MEAPRLATPADNDALLELFSQVPMTGQLVLSTQRGPDFFGLYGMQRGVAECWVGEDDSGLLGLGSILVRDGWLDGQPQRVGYLGDLRARFSGRRVRGLPRFYGQVFEAARARHGADLFLTAVLASNAAAMQALVRRSPRRPEQPWYQLLRRFSQVSIQFTGKRKPARSAPAVRRATPADVPRLAAFLDADHRQRPFGYRFDDGELQHRLAAWPGYRLEDTWLAEDTSGALLGCTTAWDPSPVKRYQVEAYRGGLVWQRRAFNAAAALLRWTPLPPPGAQFRTLYLCNTSIAQDDPAVLRALLDAIYVDARPRGYHLLSAPVYEDDALAPAFGSFTTQTLAFHLYAVSSAANPRLSLPSGRPGFEPALA